MKRKTADIASFFNKSNKKKQAEAQGSDRQGQRERSPQ